MNKVQEWTRTAGVEPNKVNATLYYMLVKEEYEELREAVLLGDFVGMVDGAVDLLWVAEGLLIMLGVDIDKAKEAVAKSNFSKFTDDEAVAKGSVKGYENSGTPAYYDTVEHEGKTLYIVRRKSNNKILKPATYEAPDWGFLIPPEWF